MARGPGAGGRGVGQQRNRNDTTGQTAKKKRTGTTGDAATPHTPYSPAPGERPSRGAGPLAPLARSYDHGLKSNQWMKSNS
jgi:hypothetical protein